MPTQDEYLITIDGEEYAVSAGSVEEAQSKAKTADGAVRRQALDEFTHGVKGRAALHERDTEPLKYAADTVKNIPASGASAVTSFIRAIPQLAEAAGSLTPGAAVHSMIRGEVPAAATMLKNAPGAMYHYAMDRYGTPENRALTMRDDPVGVVSDESAVLGGGQAALAGLRKAGPAVVRGAGTALDAATATPTRRAIGGGIIGGLTTGTPTGALVGADVAVRGGGGLNRLARTLKAFRPGAPPNLPLPPGATTPLSPESAGIVLPQPLRNNPLSLIKGMSKAGKSELADINAGEKMVAGMGGATPPPSVDQSLMDALTQALQSPSEGVAASGQPRLVKRPGATPVSRGTTPAARSAALSSEAEDIAAEYAARQAHGVGGFSRLPQLPPAELTRIQATLDAIMKRRTNPY